MRRFRPKGSMKKLMIVLALAGLVAGCAQERGGTSDQTEMNSGSYSSAPDANYTTHSPLPPPP
jgi:hypothetical protein